MFVIERNCAISLLTVIPNPAAIANRPERTEIKLTINAMIDCRPL